MYYSSLRTEVDLAKVLLSAGWRPSEINGVLQFPLSEKSYQRLGAASLFFLIADEALAMETRPGAKQAATALLQRQGWLEAEIEALLKPTRFFAANCYFPFESDFESGLESDCQSQEGFISELLMSVQPTRRSIQQLETNYSQTSYLSQGPRPQSWAGRPQLSRIKPRSQRHRQYRRRMAFNRFLGLALILTVLILFIYTL